MEAYQEQHFLNKYNEKTLFRRNEIVFNERSTTERMPLKILLYDSINLTVDFDKKDFIEDFNKNGTFKIFPEQIGTSDMHKLKITPQMSNSSQESIVFGYKIYADYVYKQLHEDPVIDKLNRFIKYEEAKKRYELLSEDVLQQKYQGKSKEMVINSLMEQQKSNPEYIEYIRKKIQAKKDDFMGLQQSVLSEGVLPIKAASEGNSVIGETDIICFPKQPILKTNTTEILVRYRVFLELNVLKTTKDATFDGVLNTYLSYAQPGTVYFKYRKRVKAIYNRMKRRYLYLVNKSLLQNISVIKLLEEQDKERVTKLNDPSIKATFTKKIFSRRLKYKMMKHGGKQNYYSNVKYKSKNGFVKGSYSRSKIHRLRDNILGEKVLTGKKRKAITVKTVNPKTNQEIVKKITPNEQLTIAQAGATIRRFSKMVMPCNAGYVDLVKPIFKKSADTNEYEYSIVVFDQNTRKKYSKYNDHPLKCYEFDERLTLMTQPKGMKSPINLNAELIVHSGNDDGTSFEKTVIAECFLSSLTASQESGYNNHKKLKCITKGLILKPKDYVTIRLVIFNPIDKELNAVLCYEGVSVNKPFIDYFESTDQDYRLVEAIPLTLEESLNEGMEDEE